MGLGLQQRIDAIGKNRLLKALATNLVIDHQQSFKAAVVITQPDGVESLSLKNSNPVFKSMLKSAGYRAS